MITQEVGEVFREYLDLSTLENLKLVNNLNESSQNQFLVALTSKLYDKIQAKATKVDYSSVEYSRGDITKIQNYPQIVESLDILRRIVVEYHENTAPVDTVINAIRNIRDRRTLFGKAFIIGSSLSILTYNTMAMAIVESTAFLISCCIEYIKDPGSDTFEVAVDKTAYQKTGQNLLFRSLADFNESCQSRQLDDALNITMSRSIARRESADLLDRRQVEIEKDHPYLTDEEIENDTFVAIHDDDKNLKEGFFGGIKNISIYAFEKVFVWLAKFFLPMIRSVVYFYYYQKQKMSDHFADIADFCEMNAYKVMENQEIPEKKRKEIYKKQMEKAAKNRKRANELSIDYNTAKSKADKDSGNENRKYDPNDIDTENDNDDGEVWGSIFESAITEGYEPFKFESPFEAADLYERNTI